MNKSLSKIAPLLIVAATFAIGAAGQESKTVTKMTGSNAVVRTYSEIPEATEPCEPAECEWWKRLRQAGNELQKKGDEKSKTKFVTLFLEGLEKLYRVPLKDRSAQTLALGPPVRVTGVNGTVELSVEFRADAYVGEISVIKGIDGEIDKRCIQAARQTIFLPAVKNGAFVGYVEKPKYSFASGSRARSLR